MSRVAGADATSAGVRGDIFVLLLVLAVFLVGAALQMLYILPNHDSVWMLVAAERVFEGGTYERDFFEVNPPLAILLHAPAIGIQKITGQTAYWSFIVLTLTYAAVSIALLRKIVADGFSPTSDFRLWLPPVAALMILILPGYDFGQREHLFCVFVLPYIALHATEASRGKLPRRFMILVSVWASLGFFLKPAFLLLPVLIALDRAVRQRSPRTFISSDMITVGVMGLLYLAVIFIRFPDYFIIVQYAMEFYDSYNNDFAIAALLPVLYMAFGLLLVFFAVRLTELPEDRRMFVLLTLAAGVASASAISQQKGWSYHILPIEIFVTLPVLMVIVIVSRKVRKSATSRAFIFLSRAAPLLVVGIPLQSLSLDSETVHRPDLVQKELYSTLAPVAANKRIYFFSTSVIVGMRWVETIQAKWASRFPCLWLLPGYVTAVNDGAISESRRVERDGNIRRYVNEDFERYRPEVVLVDRRMYKHGLLRPFEFLNFFLEEDRFAEIWESYTFYKTVDGLEIYLLSGSAGLGGSAIEASAGAPSK